MLYMLSQKPEVLKRLRQEILDHVGPSARPTHEDLGSLKYLRATINGTLRRNV
jgi:cytochrome P450